MLRNGTGMQFSTRDLMHAPKLAAEISATGRAPEFTRVCETRDYT
jgi:hypothetical protein